MKTEKNYETEINGIENYEVDTESLVTDIVAGTEIIDDFKNCIYCNEKIDKDVIFCSFCGKPQNAQSHRTADEKKIYRRKKAKKAMDGKELALSIFSYIFFGFSLFSFLGGIYRMLFMNVATISLFSTNSDSLIVNQTYVIGDLLCSLIFLIAGIFFFVIKKKENR